MSEIIFKETENIVELDKDILTFELNPLDFPDQVSAYGRSENSVIAKNLTSQAIAIRAKTTKKELYGLNPTYIIIKGNEKVEIKFIYTIKDINESPEKHKFKFEAIVIPNELINKDVKNIFDEVVKKQIQVKGITLKRNVVFKNIKNEKVFEKSPVKLPEENVKDNGEEFINLRQFNCNNQNDKLIEKQLQDIKIEFYRYKNNLTQIIETYKNLKSRVDKEMSRSGVDTTSSSVINYNLPISNSEIHVSKMKAIIITIISILLGFYLSK